jgi:hypothetical protein
MICRQCRPEGSGGKPVQITGARGPTILIMFVCYHYLSTVQIAPTDQAQFTQQLRLCYRSVQNVSRFALAGATRTPPYQQCISCHHHSTNSHDSFHSTHARTQQILSHNTHRFPTLSTTPQLTSLQACQPTHRIIWSVPVLTHINALVWLLKNVDCK